MIDRTPRATAEALAAGWAALLAVGYLIGRIVTDASWRWDWSTAQHVRGAEGQPLLGIMRILTTLGSPLVLDAVFAVALAAILVAHRRRDALFLMLAGAGSVLLGQVLRHAVARARPGGPHLTHANGFSWPSGHAGSSLALYGAVLMIGLSERPPSPRWVAYGAAGATAVLVGLIGFSRVYLGVHYPTDVAASWALVGTWLMLTWRLLGLPLSPQRARLPCTG
ncbi:MAG: superfamily protein [Solirubrobacterales bacterium]|nr:superfamily protein [Solirubrobacterales bacterium]